MFSSLAGEEAPLLTSRCSQLGNARSRSEPFSDWNNACTWAQHRKHDKKQTSVQTKVWCQTPSLSNSQTTWNTILQLLFYQGSDHTHRNYTNSLWLLHSWMNFHSVHELHWKERHWAVPGLTTRGTCLQEAKVPLYFQSQWQHNLWLELSWMKLHSVQFKLLKMTRLILSNLWRMFYLLYLSLNFTHSTQLALSVENAYSKIAALL